MSTPTATPQAAHGQPEAPPAAHAATGLPQPGPGQWEPGRRVIAPSLAPLPGHQWQEEPLMSYDGMHVAAVVRQEDDSFTMRVDGGVWDAGFDKVWSPRFLPDGRLAAIVQQDGEWTVAVDGEPWPETYGFIWSLVHGPAGKLIAAVQQDMRYGMIVDGEPWETLYENANNFSISPDGRRTAAVVQTVPLGQADIETFVRGVYSVAVDGEAWGHNFMNVWTPVFDNRNDRVAAQVRLSHSEYTVVVNGTPWPATFPCVWEPCFDPATGAVAAPVRKDGRWGMALDGTLLWEARFFQCWSPAWSPDGRHLWAIVAPGYGNFTVARDAAPWPFTAPVITDLVLSPDGKRAAALASNDNTAWQVVVDGVAWPGKWDMAWRPVFSPCGRHVAVRVRQGGRETVLLDGRPWRDAFTTAWDPVFGPSDSGTGTTVLLRGIRDGACERWVATPDDFRA